MKKKEDREKGEERGGRIERQDDKDVHDSDNNTTALL